MNYFEALGIPIRYNIDEDALTRTYLQKQALLHPDVNDAESERSAFLNKAYKILLSPLDRAGYFLEIHKRHSDNLDAEFTFEAFNLREQYETLESSKDKKSFHDTLSRRIFELVTTLRNLEDNLDEFQKNYGLLRFIASFLEKIKSDVYSWN
ncbi:MAG: Fe-S protein assembly co-chaperone HscB [Holosporaceae bacterium]|jgi:molecular chaperone HscB|nr:Fe-S protein assembly co-chaperone HscB [Holosporaceae bacterium]